MHKIKVQDVAQTSLTNNRVATTEWAGRNVKVERFVSATTMRAIVENIVSSAFLGDDVYSPETLDFVFKCEIINAFSNIELPKSVEDASAIIYGTDLFDIVRQGISESQYDDICDAVDERISYMLDASKEAVRRAFADLESVIESLRASLRKLLLTADKGDVENLIQVLKTSLPNIKEN